jgi:hypothetical protein
MEELGGKSFFRSVQDWNERPILGAMLEHGKDMHSEGEHHLDEHCYGGGADPLRSIIDAGDGNIQPRILKSVKKPLRSFAEDQRGYPQLPEPRDEEQTLSGQKELIRSFMTATYRE